MEQAVTDLPKYCTVGTKKNAKGYKESWNGYKLHLGTADCGVTISALTTAASVHDSQVLNPLSRKSEQRVTFLYELADAAYCSKELREDSIKRNHVPLFDHNRRGGEKRPFAPHEAQHYKDRYALRQSWVRGGPKVDAFLMFGVLCMSTRRHYLAITAAAVGAAIHCYNRILLGTVDERFKSHAWKACEG